MVKEEWKYRNFLITKDKNDLDINAIYNFLSKESYWSKGISMDEVVKSIRNSALCFGMYHVNHYNEKTLIGFARVISDLVTFTFLTDVFVIKEYRSQGLGKWLIQTITDYHELDIRRIMLSTDDGHSLYSEYGFEALDKPNVFMQIKGKGAI
ncbi:GNAT family N-acetyltransferase [Salipaludibacillus sp. CF4.18]|uniref:GNAT family N-acetyltransferase n=1 Tax=Salipaludibacillus sp. CF4.18 TaxID=3373081 RepID=UPI003EE48EEC